MKKDITTPRRGRNEYPGVKESCRQFSEAPIGFQFRVIHEQFEAIMQQELKDSNVTYTQMSVLHYLDHHRDHSVTQKELAQGLHVSAPTASGVLRRMQDAGLIRQEVASTNRRYRYIVLDTAGQKVLDSQHSIKQEKDRMLVRDFSPEEQKELRTLLMKVHENLAAEIQRRERKNGRNPDHPIRKGRNADAENTVKAAERI